MKNKIIFLVVVLIIFGTIPKVWRYAKNSHVKFEPFTAY